MTREKSDNELSNGEHPREIRSPFEPTPLRFSGRPSKDNVPGSVLDKTPTPERGSPPVIPHMARRLFSKFATALGLVGLVGGGVAATVLSTTEIEVDVPIPQGSDLFPEVFNVDPIANGLVSTVHGGTPIERAQASSALRAAIKAVWIEFENVMKEIAHDGLKDLVKVGLEAIAISYLILPLRRRLRQHTDNPVVSEIDSRLQVLEDKLKTDPHAQLNDRNVAVWINISRPEAELLLRAIKLVPIDDRWHLDTNRSELRLASFGGTEA